MPEEKKLADELNSLRDEVELLKKENEALKYERVLMNALMDNIPDSIYFKDRECRLVKISNKMLHDLKYDNMSDVLGKTDVELFGEEFGRKKIAEDIELMETARPITGMMEVRQLENGDVNWTLTDKVPIYDDKKNVVGLVGITREINELIKAQEEREQERNLLRTLIDNLPDYIYVKNGDGKFVLANLAVAKQFGFDSYLDLINKSDFDLFPPELAQKYHSKEQSIINSETGIYNFEGPTIDLSKGKKHRWISSTKVPLIDSQGKVNGFVGIGRDITERKEIEEKLHDVYEDLKELNKTKDKFFSIIAHDMRSPFQGLMGYSEILANEFYSLSDEEKIFYIKNIDELTKSTYNLLENLLEWSRIQTGKIIFDPKTINLYDALKSNLELLRQTASNKNILLECSVDKNVSVKADHNMLTTVVRNLVTNAIKFTRLGGKINIASKVNGDFVEVSIRDTGVGISKKNLDNLFKVDKNVTTKGTANEEGSGLGLILCKEMIQMHGGNINVESEVGIGTTFSFTVLKAE